jgi:hypothetical protein
VSGRAVQMEFWQLLAPPTVLKECKLGFDQRERGRKEGREQNGKTAGEKIWCPPGTSHSETRPQVLHRFLPVGKPARSFHEVVQLPLTISLSSAAAALLRRASLWFRDIFFAIAATRSQRVRCLQRPKAALQKAYHKKASPTHNRGLDQDPPRRGLDFGMNQNGAVGKVRDETEEGRFVAVKGTGTTVDEVSTQYIEHHFRFREDFRLRQSLLKSEGCRR